MGILDFLLLLGTWGGGFLPYALLDRLDDQSHGVLGGVVVGEPQADAVQFLALDGAVL